MILLLIKYKYEYCFLFFLHEEPCNVDVANKPLLLSLSLLLLLLLLLFLLLFLGRCGPKNQNCQFRLKFGTKTNSNIQNSMLMISFSVLDQKYTFWGKFGTKIKSC